MLNTTVGSVLVNDVLPDELRNYAPATLDKKGVAALLRQVAEKYPDRYSDVAQKLMQLGGHNVQAAGTSIKLSDFLPPQHIEDQLNHLRKTVQAIASDRSKSDEQRNKAIIDMVMDHSSKIEKDLFHHALENGNSLAEQVQSGSRGNSTQFKQIVAGDMLVADHRDRVIPVPVLRGYASGVEPAEYFAGAYGARKGTVSTKFATQNAGFLGKQLAMVAHRLTVTDEDCGTASGLPVDGGDKDNIGSVLARDIGDLKAGTVLTSGQVRKLAGKKVLVRSAATCQADQGVCAHCAGVREHGRLPEVGDNVGMGAAQAVAEPLAQSMLSAKHSGGTVSGRKAEESGFDYINRIVQVPKAFAGAATLSKLDGYVHAVEDAPQGGKYITIGGEKHYVSPDVDVTIKPGDSVEAGDPLTTGTANPAEVVKYRGIGEGRRSFITTFGKALANSGIPAHRRNVELISRGLINHVRSMDMDDSMTTLPDDILPYDSIASQYRRRPNTTSLHPGKALGKYLEKPALHYSIGTRITPKVSQEMGEFGVDSIDVHDEPPAFEPHMVQGREIGLKDTNPITRLGGSYLEKGTLESVHRGRTAPIHDTSYMPSLALSDDFGKSIKSDGKY